MAVAKRDGRTKVDDEHQLKGLYLTLSQGVQQLRQPPADGHPRMRAGSMAAEIDREQVQADLEAIRGQIDEAIYKKLIRWLDRGEPEYLRLAEEKIESLADSHRMTWGQVDLPEEGSGKGLDEFR